MNRRVTAEEAKRMAEMALRNLKRHEEAGNMDQAFGAAWFTLASIAGTPDLPLPHQERAALRQAQEAPHAPR